MVGDTEIAYLAGLFDGEGCVGFYRHKESPTNEYVRVGCTNTVRTPLELLVKNFGGKIYTPKKRDNRKQQFEWVAYSFSALPLLEAIKPFSIIKRDKIDKAIQLLKSRL